MQDFLQRSPVKFWMRIFGIFGKTLGQVLGQNLLQVLGQNLLCKFWDRIFPPGSGGKLWGKFWDRIFFSRSLPPAAKTPKLPRYKRGDARTSVHLPPPSTSLVESPPPSVSLRATAPSGFPRCRGLCPLGGACSPGGPVPRFRSGIWDPLHNPPFYSDPEGRHVPCLGVCPFPSQKAWPHRPLGPP